ncbi:glycosyltransferase family 9 protein [bacterium]|nr:glycosyltransferase family 9 protein [bacterium]
MTPLISGLKAAFPDAGIDVLISEGFEEVLENNPCVDRIILFEKKRSRINPLNYIKLIRRLKQMRYDCAVDVSDGHHFSLNNVLLTCFSGARYRLGYDRKDAESFLNILLPPPPEGTHMADAMLGIVKGIAPGIPEYSMAYYITDMDRTFAEEWLIEHEITEFDSFFIIHPGGRGRKKWGARNFAGLIDTLVSQTGARIVVIGGPGDKKTIVSIRELSQTSLDVLENVTVGQMAAVIEHCDLFISGDTGPMHVSVALNRPTIGIFIASDFRVYGPRGRYGRIVIGGEQGIPSIDDVLLAIQDLFGDPAQTC